jgi:hypothetical protein
MDINDEILMALADGELDEPQRSSVEAAVAADPAIARRVADFRAQRSRLVAEFAPQLGEPVPERLLAVMRRGGAPSAKVVDLTERRAARRLRGALRNLSWAEVGAIAASLVVAVLVGVEAVHDDGRGALRLSAGGLLADRQVAAALTSQLAESEPADAAVRVGISFVNRHGDLCRTFIARGEGGVAGIACRDRGEWRVGIAEPVRLPSGSPEGGSVRMAQGEIPASVMRAVEDQIRGEPLDAAAERAARDAGWRAPTR